MIYDLYVIQYSNGYEQASKDFANTMYTIKNKFKTLLKSFETPKISKKLK